ncbi:hypothetical protein [uncultured Aquimarina sp.]|uniref:hypothetical protein n=1 Tax=uncultured Aquimarina sp. TaxID=575652 RepID=UPI002625C9ED|nr:hypothetical protein [uncultured Aquimarina sp.]
MKRDLDLLYSFITGMKLTAIGNNVDLKNLEELDSFSKHIHEKLDIADTNTMGWFGVIRDKHGSGEEGFNKFFEYFDEWRSGKYTL